MTSSDKKRKMPTDSMSLYDKKRKTPIDLKSEKSRLVLRVSQDSRYSKVDAGSKFYMIDLNNHPPADRYASELHPFSETPPGLSTYQFRCVIWESSIIYLLRESRITSDCRRGSGMSGREVYYFDIRSPESGWRLGPPMTAKRSTPCCQVVNGLIYVMHGEPFSCDFNGSWGEVLDPTRNEWTVLPHPGRILMTVKSNHEKNDDYSGDGNHLLPRAILPRPGPGVVLPHPGPEAVLPHPGQIMMTAPESDSSVFVTSIAMSEDGNHLLLWYPPGRTLFLYDLHSKSWEVFANNFDRFLSYGVETYSPCPVVDDVLYYFDRKLRAYDLKNRRPISSAVKGLNFKDISPPLIDTNGWGSPDENHPPAFVVHLGNRNLCLVWTEEGNHRVVHCTKFRVSKHSDGEDETIIHAIIQSYAIYNVCDSITDCFAIY